MRKVGVVLAAWLLAGVAQAGSEAEVRRQIEASMLVAGTLSVDATGTVTAHTLDKRGKLPAPVVELLDRTLPAFRFKPVMHDGQPTAAVARMSLKVVAHQEDPQHISLRLSSAHFTDSGQPAVEKASIRQRIPMRYPAKAMTRGISGTVYVALRIDRTGHVVDAQALQVNLKYVDNEAGMAEARELLAKPTLAAVRGFTFDIPTAGKHAGDEFFTGTLPVVYVFDDQHLPGVGEWDTYVAGPKQDIAWLHDEDDRDSDNSDAVPDGEFAMTGDNLQLLTPLGD